MNKIMLGLCCLAFVIWGLAILGHAIGVEGYGFPHNDSDEISPLECKQQCAPGYWECKPLADGEFRKGYLEGYSAAFKEYGCQLSAFTELEVYDNFVESSCFCYDESCNSKIMQIGNN